MAEELGIKTKKNENFSEWYLELVRKAGFIDQRVPLKGFDVFMPWGYAVWENFRKKADLMFSELGVKNCYFPMLIPQSFFEKESEHFEGFNPELVKIKEVGGEKLSEPLVLRTTSETIIYHMFSQWIRSYRDLPLKINQWANIIRWETKMTKPLIRPREFLWQEGHTAHESREDALKFIEKVKDVYVKLHELLCLSCLILRRTDADKFAGAEITIAFDLCMPDGKIVQGATEHLLSEEFTKAFNVTFLDRDEKKKYVRTTSWGLSEREIGMMLMVHGDDKGAVIPPSVAPLQVIIVPIYFRDSKGKIMEKAKEIKTNLEEFGLRVDVDERDYTPGFKFNDWELRGVPLRLELGPKDLEKEQVIIVRRDSNERVALKFSELSRIKEVLDKMQADMLLRAKNLLKESIRDASDLEELKRIIREKGGFVRTNWCGEAECEKRIKEYTGGAEIRGTLFDKKEAVFGSCVYCKRPGKEVVYVAKAY